MALITQFLKTCEQNETPYEDEGKGNKDGKQPINIVRRIKLSLANKLIKFVDRDLGLRQVEDWANKGTYPVQVVYGPEGCGKTAWLRQSAELLRELGFEVFT